MYYIRGILYIWTLLHLLRNFNCKLSDWSDLTHTHFIELFSIFCSQTTLFHTHVWCLYQPCCVGTPIPKALSSADLFGFILDELPVSPLPKLALVIWLSKVIWLSFPLLRRIIWSRRILRSSKLVGSLDPFSKLLLCKARSRFSTL